VDNNILKLSPDQITAFYYAVAAESPVASRVIAISFSGFKEPSKAYVPTEGVVGTSGAACVAAEAAEPSVPGVSSTT
tara:strand:- start:69 stop:299 length:231 start_codon:yes stop_codon:yes gene_type:complete